MRGMQDRKGFKKGDNGVKPTSGILGPLFLFEGSLVSSSAENGELSKLVFARKNNAKVGFRKGREFS